MQAQSELELYMQPENHMPLDRISVSSGAFGSQPAFDSRGRLTRFEVQPCLCLASRNACSRAAWIKPAWP